MASCPICNSTAGAWRRTPEVDILRCRKCGHRQARFLQTPVDEDYHVQYVGGARLDSLQLTRERQAGVILAAVRRHRPDADDVLDFGAGRGWFLKACRDLGVKRGAAADTSDLAVRVAAEDGFAAVRLPEGEKSDEVAAALSELPFRPRVLTLLDVVEHLSPTRLEHHLRVLIHSLRPELEIVVVKVPVAEGLLHRSASLASLLRASGPLHQLYQAGTFPPHHNYFTRCSLARLACNLDWDVLEVVGDADFEPAALGDRIVGLSGFPRVVRQSIGRSAGFVVSVTRMYDSQILVARVRN